jgi:hypothetical protein
MSVAKKLSARATIYLDPKLHKALKLKAVETDVSISDVVNEAVKELLSEDADDLSAFEARKNEATSDFADFVKRLKRDGKL